MTPPPLFVQMGERQLWSVCLLQSIEIVEGVQLPLPENNNQHRGPAAYWCDGFKRIYAELAGWGCVFVLQQR